MRYLKQLFLLFVVAGIGGVVAAIDPGGAVARGGSGEVSGGSEELAPVEVETVQFAGPPCSDFLPSWDASSVCEVRDVFSETGRQVKETIGGWRAGWEAKKRVKAEAKKSKKDGKVKGGKAKKRSKADLEELVTVLGAQLEASQQETREARASSVAAAERESSARRAVAQAEGEVETTRKELQSVRVELQVVKSAATKSKDTHLEEVSSLQQKLVVEQEKADDLNTRVSELSDNKAQVEDQLAKESKTASEEVTRLRLDNQGLLKKVEGLVVQLELNTKACAAVDKKREGLETSLIAAEVHRKELEERISAHESDEVERASELTRATKKAVEANDQAVEMTMRATQLATQLAEAREAGEEAERRLAQAKESEALARESEARAKEAEADAREKEGEARRAEAGAKEKEGEARWGEEVAKQAASDARGEADEETRAADRARRAEANIRETMRVLALRMKTDRREAAENLRVERAERLEETVRAGEELAGVKEDAAALRLEADGLAKEVARLEAEVKTLRDDGRMAQDASSKEIAELRQELRLKVEDETRTEEKQAATARQLHALEEEKAALETRLGELKGAQSSQAAELSRLTSLFDQAVDKTIKLEAELKAASSQLLTVEGERDDFASRIKDLTKKLAARSPMSQSASAEVGDAGAVNNTSEEDEALRKQEPPVGSESVDAAADAVDEIAAAAAAAAAASAASTAVSEVSPDPLETKVSPHRDAAAASPGAQDAGAAVQAEDEGDEDGMVPLQPDESRPSATAAVAPPGAEDGGAAGEAQEDALELAGEDEMVLSQPNVMSTGDTASAPAVAAFPRAEGGNAQEEALGRGGDDGMPPPVGEGDEPMVETTSGEVETLLSMPEGTDAVENVRERPAPVEARVLFDLEDSHMERGAEQRAGPTPAAVEPRGGDGVGEPAASTAGAGEEPAMAPAAIAGEERLPGKLGVHDADSPVFRDISPGVSTNSFVEHTIGESGTYLVFAPEPSVATATETVVGASSKVAAHLGCFELKVYAMEGLRVEYGDGDASLTPARCIETCGANGRTSLFPAVILGSICECMPYDDKSLKHLEAGDACDTPCPGDETFTCGGPTSFELYEILPTGAGEGVRAVLADADDGGDGSAVVADNAHGQRVSANSGVLIVDLQHVGCFMDDFYEEDENHDYDFYGNTPSACLRTCITQATVETPYVSLRGDLCLCREAEAFNGLPGVCREPCPGDESLMCGGRSAFDLYKMVERR
eukprot:g8245.t1